LRHARNYGRETVKNKERYRLTLIPTSPLGQSMSVAERIRDKLAVSFAPSEISVTDDSHRHAGHSGATREDGSQGETHFTVRIVAETFAGLSRVERQRRVYAALAEEMQGPVHALSLTALSPAEI
jgi:BolA family transcriptional regulator, general stress-responsive regulator